MEGINAKYARKISEDNKELVLKELEVKIYERALSLKNNLYLSDFNIEPVNKKILEDRGFTVDVGGKYNETNTNISW
jgi:hypothetical protein